MKVVPYREVLGVRFGASLAEVVDKHGQPEQQTESRMGDKELQYSNKIFRLQPESGTLHEVTFNSEYLILDGQEIGFAALGFFVAKNDSDSFESSGFIISPRFGLAFDPHDSYFLTVFCSEDLDKWRS